MNPDQGNDKSGKPGAGGGAEKKPAGAGAPGGAGADGKSAGGAGAGASGAGKDDKCSGKDDKCAGKDEPKGLQKVFDAYCKSGGMGGGGSGISKENGKKWMKAAGLLDEKTGCNEQDFDKAFDKACKGEKSVDFCGFKELIEALGKEKKKEPKEFFDKLIAAGPPKEAAM